MTQFLFVLSLVCGLSNVARAAPSNVRATAQSLLEAAPDQYTFYAMFAPWDEDDDDEDRQEAEIKRLEKLKELNEQYKAANSVITRSSSLYDIVRLHYERIDFLRAAAIQSFAGDFDRWWIGETLAEPEMHQEAVKEELLTLVNKLREFTANFAKDPRDAEIHWMLGSAMAILDNEHFELYLKQAKQVGKNPEWTRRAILTKADWLIQKKRFGDAEVLYEEVRKDKIQDLLKEYATYRLAWIYLHKALSPDSPDSKNAGKKADYLKKAEIALQQVVLAIEEDEDTRFQLRREAIKDLSWIWAYLDDEPSALAFFEQADLKKQIPVFKDKLAFEWLKQGKLDKAVPYFQAKVTEDPEDAKRPDMHLRLAHAYIAAGDVAGMQREIQSLIKITTDKEDDWFDEHEDDEKLMSRTKKMHELLPVTAGFRLLDTAQAQSDPKRKKAILTAAITELQSQIPKVKDDAKLVTLYIAVFQSSLELERYMDALAQLDGIVAMGPRAGAQLEVAAFERVKLLVKLIEEQPAPQLPPPGEVKKPIPLSDLQVRFARAANEYLKIAPAAENALNIRYQIAQDLFNLGHYSEALPLLETIANEFPRTDQGKAAIEICVSMNLKFEKWDELIRLSTSFLNNREVKGKALREFLKQNLDWAKSQKPTN